MNKKITPKSWYILPLLLALLGAGQVVFGQSIFIGTPTLGFSQACASNSFNSYNISFTFMPASNLQAGNQFIIELSDANGDFSNPTIVRTLSQNTSPVNTSFSLPNNIHGEQFRVRVRSTAPIATSTPSIAFAAHFAPHNQPFSVNNNIGTVLLCEGGNYTLSIDNTNNQNSPLYYPELNYIWYRNFVEIPGQNGPNLTINQAGNYYAIVDYGSCIMNSYSNMISVEQISGMNLQISTATPGTTICSEQHKTLVSSEQNSNFNYQWLRNGSPISGANQATYNATQAGNYSLRINVGSCQFESNAIALDLIQIQSSWDVNEIEYLIPGNTITANVTSNAVHPTYVWRRNNTIIPNVNSNSYTITQTGNYTVTITDPNNCNYSQTLATNVQALNNYQLQVHAVGDYQECSSTSTQLNVLQFVAMAGTQQINMTEHLDNANFQWYKNGSSIPNQTQSTLLVDSNLGSGNYQLRISLPTLTNSIQSNILTINLSQNEVIEITQNGNLCDDDAPVILSSNSNNTQYGYQWYRNNTLINGATNANLSTTEVGVYQLHVTINQCTIVSNTIELNIQDRMMEIINGEQIMMIPGEQLQIQSITNLEQPTYQWYRNDVAISGAVNSSYTAQTDGVYKLVATQGVGCAISIVDQITILYPSNFNLTIQANASYQHCNSSSATLSIFTITATTDNGTVNLDPTTPGLTFQWRKNGINIPNATNRNLIIENATENGTYSLEINLPDFETIISNEIAIALKIETPTLTINGQLCGTQNALISASISNENYTYSWYRNGQMIATNNQSSWEANEPGMYHVVIAHGSCTSTSANIEIEEVEFQISLTPNTTTLLLPQQTITLEVTASQTNVTYTWYRDNVVLTDESQSTIEVTTFGTYKVIVTTNDTCAISKEATVNIIIPTHFSLTIATQGNYADCASQQTEIHIVNFTAHSQLGDTNLTNTVGQYPIQWWREGSVISNQNSNQIHIENADQNGDYWAYITVPGFNTVQSNTINVHLGLPFEFNIIGNSHFICENSTTPILLHLDNLDASYSYQWFQHGNQEILGTDHSLEVYSAGSYYVQIVYDDCLYTSNHFEVNTVNFNDFHISENTEFGLFDGSTTTVYAYGSETYEWYINNQLVGVGSQYNVTEPGEYKVIGSQGNCNSEIEFIVFGIQNNSLVIPNVITRNGDGYNDVWSIPSSYTNKENVIITIYHSSGKVLFRTINYTNNWPSPDFVVNKKDPVVYYTIEEDSIVTKKGSITIIE